MGRIAIIVPRCAETAYGGAEALALKTAIDLSARHEVEILTTRAVDYWSWANDLPAGADAIDGIPVRRFSVDEPRHLAAFDRLSRSFRYRIAELDKGEQERWLKAQGPYSTELFAYLFQHRSDYDAFVFMPYLYATTYFGLPLVKDRAILMSLAHDEWPLYFSVWDDIIRDARAVVPITPGEAALLRKRFPDISLGDILEPAILSDAPALGTVTPAVPTPFILYLGRIDESKGLTSLAEHFEAHMQADPASNWRVVVAGPGSAVLNEHFIHVGAVEEEEKWRLLRTCDAFVMPSLHESLSIAMIEAWSVGKPTLVDARNTVLVDQTRRAQGGLWYSDAASFNSALSVLDQPTRAALGRQGRAFVDRTYKQGNTLAIFDQALKRLA